MDVSHILDNLNKPQRNAVSATAKPILVLAGAGSGKTRVLVHRIAWLMSVEQCDAYRILAVTFTNKAAAEMRQRIEVLYNRPLGGMWVGTFHSIAHRLLRRHWKEAKLSQSFQILDSDDQLRIVKRVTRELNIDDKQWPPRKSQWYINNKKDEGIRPISIEDKGDPHEATLCRIYTEYEIQCKRSNVIDFAEMLLCSLELLRDNPPILEHYQSRFKHLLVDEFQDTNTLQYAWLRLLAGDHTPLFAVGDDDQSIYGWRGAKIENIQAFSLHYPTAELIKLEQNYRSNHIILEAANSVIKHNSTRIGKNLWTENKSGDLIHLYTAFNEQDEAKYITSRIQRWHSQGNKRQECAILYRSNAQSRVLESALLDSKIPYRIYGGLRFFDRAEIKDALAYLRLTTHRDDDPSFERVVNHPPRGIGIRTIEIIREAARVHNLSLWQAAKQLVENAGITARAQKSVLHFLNLINDISHEVSHLALEEQVKRIIEASTLKPYYLAKEAKDKGEERETNLNELVSAAKSFNFRPEDDHADMNDLTAFLSHASLEAGEGQTTQDDDCVELMTVHAAKGLEFPLIALCGMEEGLFPHQNSLDKNSHLEEERRLCYVAITRAKKQLILSFAESRRLYQDVKFNKPSRFISEIPRALIETIRSHTRPSFTSNTPTVKKLSIRRTNETGFSIGNRVTHATFGKGTVTNYEGAGKAARVQVNFDSAGSKWLILSYANLKHA